MSILLTPRIYNKDFQWNIASKNIVDSVTFTPVIGDINDDTENIHTESFTTVQIQGTNSNVNLPIASNTTPTYWRYMTNTHLATFVQVDYAKARIECVMATGSKRITLNTALPEMPNASIRLSGNSYVITRGDSTFDDYPSLDNIRDKSFNLTSWIKSNYDMQNASLLWDYSKNTFSMNPWVRNFVPLTEVTTPDDIITTWGYYSPYYPGLLSHSFPDKYSWTDQPSFGDIDNLSTVAVNPIQPMYDELPGISFEGFPADNAIIMYDLRVPITCNVRKIDDYTFDIDWVAPVRLSYMAASRTRSSAGANSDLDNYAFVDEMTQVDVVLSGRQFNTDTYDVTYAKNAISENILKVSETPFLTSRTYFGTDTNKWDKTLANRLLNKYAKGKYIIKCKVPTTWLLQQNISIGSTIDIILQDGNYIARGNNICMFKVHNIEFNYQPEEFKSTLTLMEV